MSLWSSWPCLLTFDEALRLTAVRALMVKVCLTVAHLSKTCMTIEEPQSLRLDEWPFRTFPNAASSSFNVDLTSSCELLPEVVGKELRVRVAGVFYSIYRRGTCRPFGTKSLDLGRIKMWPTTWMQWATFVNVRQSTPNAVASITEGQPHPQEGRAFFAPSRFQSHGRTERMESFRPSIRPYTLRKTHAWRTDDFNLYVSTVPFPATPIDFVIVAGPALFLRDKCEFKNGN